MSDLIRDNTTNVLLHDILFSFPARGGISTWATEKCGWRVELFADHFPDLSSSEQRVASVYFNTRL
jgi:hypothetical protein